MIIELLGFRLATFVTVAQELGVTTNQVYMWHQRRHGNGFPEAVIHRPAGNGVKDAPWFDLDEVTAWRDTYIPPTGGYSSHKAVRAREVPVMMPSRAGGPGELLRSPPPSGCA